MIQSLTCTEYHAKSGHLSLDCLLLGGISLIIKASLAKYYIHQVTLSFLRLMHAL